MNIEQSLRAYWGASKMPFQDTPSRLFEYPELQQASHTLKRYLGMKASGVLSGANGCGKTVLLDHVLHELPEQKFIVIRLSHTTLTGSDMIRWLCRLNGLQASIRRSDNLYELLEYWNTDGRIPVIAIDEAQNLNPATLEELRLLNCERTRTGGRDVVSPFALLLCGDEDLMPTINLNIHRALRSRLTFYTRIEPFTQDRTQKYCEFQWEEVGVKTSPFDLQTITLLHTASEGHPRAINQLALNSIINALDQQDKVIKVEHVQAVLKVTPWIGKYTY